MILKDGTGTGKEAKVDDTNRLATESVTITAQTEAALREVSYQVGSGVITLTNASESAVLYLKNNENEDLIITGVNITSTAHTTATSNVFLAKIYLDGTALSAGTSAAALNNNFGSSRQLDADITQGEQGATVTNGVVSGAFYIPAETFFNTEISWILPKGKSVAVTITPATSNTSISLSVTLEAHLER